MLYHQCKERRHFVQVRQAAGGFAHQKDTAEKKAGEGGCCSAKVFPASRVHATTTQLLSYFGEEGGGGGGGGVGGERRCLLLLLGAAFDVV